MDSCSREEAGRPTVLQLQLCPPHARGVWAMARGEPRLRGSAFTREGRLSTSCLSSSGMNNNGGGGLREANDEWPLNFLLRRAVLCRFVFMLIYAHGIRM